MVSSNEQHEALEGSSPEVAQLSRRSVLAGAAVTAAATVMAPSAASAAPTVATPRSVDLAEHGRSRLPSGLADVIDAWAQSPSNHPVMGDWRRVGYRRGTRKPGPTVKRVLTAKSLGIRPGGEADVSKPLQDGLDRLGKSGGGILQLDRGRYVLDRPLFVHHSNVVLRGAGKNKTTLFFSKPLKESLQAGAGWSWTGGQIFFISRERLAKSESLNWADGQEGWLPGASLAKVAPATRGTDVLMVDDSSGVKTGDMVLLEVDNLGDRRLLHEIGGDVSGAQTYNWAVSASTIAHPTAVEDLKTWRWPVRVTEVLTPRTIRIEQPLRLTIHRETPARILALGPSVHDSGVEGLTIENKLITQTAHNQNPGSNGVCFQAVHDCWAKDIHVLNADVAFSMTTAKSCTLSGISAGGRSLHHFVACRLASHDNLVEDFELEEFTVPAVAGSYLHGINLEGLSSGNVYRDGRMHTGTFDSHRWMPFENLRTDITITNKDAVPGGASNAGPYFGARTVHWGITVTNGKNLCMDISDVAPRSLTAGIVGLTAPGSGGLNTPFLAGGFTGDIESERLAFGSKLKKGADLLDIQRAVAPVS